MLAQPIVIFGGFLSSPGIYREMREVLASLTAQPVWVVPAYGPHWLGSIIPRGWSFLLGKLAHTVRAAVRASPAGKVTIVGHSTGGVMARLFLSSEPYLGHSYGGCAYVSHVVSLGSPHHNRRGSFMRRWVDAHYPGAFFAPQVAYTAVAGKLIRGDCAGSTQARAAYRFYQQLGGDGNAYGDGLVPVACALLDGAQAVVLDDVCHAPGFGKQWYGTPEVVTLWWKATQ